MTSRQDAAASLRKVKVTFIIIGIIMVGIGFYKHMAYDIIASLVIGMIMIL